MGQNTRRELDQVTPPSVVFHNLELDAEVIAQPVFALMKSINSTYSIPSA